MTAHARRTISILLGVLVVLAALFMAATPVCIWVDSVEDCERLFCELLVMRRPHADVSYCEAWFDLWKG